MYTYRWLLQSVDVIGAMPAVVATVGAPAAQEAALHKDRVVDGISHPGERHLLHNINLAIKPGDWVNLIGSNGSGKSTLAKVIAGFGQHKVTGMFESYVGSNVVSGLSGFAPLVSQNPELAIVGMTAEEDAILLLEQLGIPEGEIPSRVADALQRTGLVSIADKPIGQLSGGQKQLAAIAGCIASGADALILDEPTSMLDPDASAAVLRTVRELNRSGTTVIWVTQQLDELIEGDRVVALMDGHIAFDGESSRFFSRSNGEAESACEQAGLIAPYLVQTIWALQKEGIELVPSMPISMQAFVKAVAGYGE